MFGFHLSADEEGCKGLLELLTLMEHARYPSLKEIRLVKPVTAPIHAGDLASAETFVIRYPKGRVFDEHWELDRDGRQVRLAVGLAYLHALQEGVAEIQSGLGDYSLGPRVEGDEETHLWVWGWGAP